MLIKIKINKTHTQTHCLFIYLFEFVYSMSYDGLNKDLFLKYNLGQLF